MKMPKFEVVKEKILSYIRAMPEGQDYLPYEGEMEKMFKVSKRTVRRALLDLREGGLIDTAQNRGSRVVRSPPVSSNQTRQTAPPKFMRFLEGRCVASIFMSDKPGAERTDSLQWRLTGDLEVKVSQAGGRLALYNMRDAKWGDVNAAVNSMLENKIDWVFCNLTANQPIQPHLLLDNRIKPMAFIQDMNAINGVAHRLVQGVDSIVINDLSGIYERLRKDFSDVDFVAYLGGETDLNWEQPRADAVRRFAEERGIPMETSLGHSSGADKAGVNGDYDAMQQARAKVGYDSTLALISRIKECKRPLLLGANDNYACGILQCLEEQKVVIPREVEVIGYDNSNLAMQNNLSSFYLDCGRIVETAFEFCRMFHGRKGESLSQSNAKLMPPSFFRRMSTR